MADGAMRECLICARDDRIATCIDWQAHQDPSSMIVAWLAKNINTHVEALEVLADLEHELFRPFVSLWKAIVRAVCLW